jgi:phosphoglycolate phosphatase
MTIKNALDVIKNAQDARLIVFDWDGTLFDSTGVIAHSLQQACLAVNVRVPSTAQAKFVIGLGLDEVVAQLVGGVDAAQREAFMLAYRRTYLGSEHLVRLYDGIEPLLVQLRALGKTLCIATGKSRAGLDRILQHNPDFAGLFDQTRTADQTQSKPHPQMLHELMAACDVPAAHTVMVGDTTYDVEMAHNAGVRSIALAYGAHDAATLMASNPSCFAHDVAQLATLLRGNDVLSVTT